MKTYTVVGTSVRNGRQAVRYSNANPVVRGQHMLKTGNTMIALYQLPHPMNREDAHNAFMDFDCEAAAPAYRSPDYPV
ncbi:hypothetical protein UFOVP1369_13 [uncultured Caudovirales phage]|uniref:Uncharacterized protein n=1 Tax=uncultured Caudovirales phage TaxID=2100421 RepID=A0A6J5RVJ5_9CAUD|nr:hypothetical protein UFOVP1369_13 [uncultured Caudovirales phage]